MMTRATRWLAVAACVVAGLFWPVSWARGQIAGTMDVTAMIAPISTRSLDLYGRILSLDADQMSAARTLLQGYQAQHREAVAAFQKQMESLQKEMEETQDWMSYGRRMREIGVKVRDEVESAERNFMNDLKVLLNERQAGDFPRVERARRRENLLRFGFVAGQAVDLFTVAESAKVAERPAVQELLRAYEVEIDRRLEDFERWQRDQERAFENMDPMNFDMERLSKTMGEMFDRSRQVRDINRRYARQIGTAVGEADGARFTDEFNRRAHPRVYRPAHAHQCLRAAEGFADLSAQQKEEVRLLRESYEREAAAANARWAAAVEAAEDKRGSNWMEEMMQRAMGGGGRDDGVGDAKKARQDLDDRTLERLKAILTKEQAARLPEKPEAKPSPMGDMEDMFYMPDADPEIP